MNSAPRALRQPNISAPSPPPPLTRSGAPACVGAGRSDVVIGSAPHASVQLVGWDPAAWGLDVPGAGIGAGTSMPLRRARLAADLRGAMAAPAGADAWGPLCEKKPRYNASNATLFRTVVTGAEARRAATRTRSPAARSPNMHGALEPRHPPRQDS